MRNHLPTYLAGEAHVLQLVLGVEDGVHACAATDLVTQRAVVAHYAYKGTVRKGAVCDNPVPCVHQTNDPGERAEAHLLQPEDRVAVVVRHPATVGRQTDVERARATLGWVARKLAVEATRAVPLRHEIAQPQCLGAVGVAIVTLAMLQEPLCSSLQCPQPFCHSPVRQTRVFVPSSDGTRGGRVAHYPAGSPVARAVRCGAADVPVDNTTPTCLAAARASPTAEAPEDPKWGRKWPREGPLGPISAAISSGTRRRAARAGA
eukprot:scaffold304_cov409-Prasinococcus_capsulatus_cf.AAC.13